MKDFHRCTEEDYSKFNPVNPQSQFLFEEIKKGEKRGFYCIDWEDDDLYIFGDEYDKEYQRIEFLLTPCNYIH